MDSVKNAIRPKTLARVIDLVAEAGVDVTHWSKYSGQHASQNPRHCYEWAFDDGVIMIIVFSLWWSAIEPSSEGGCMYTVNARKTANESTGARRSRAIRMDQLLRFASVNKMPVQVILNVSKDVGSTESVGLRGLDSERWMVSSYDQETGACELARGVVPLHTIDQFAIEREEVGADGQTVRTSNVYNRSPIVREYALRRADGHCEYCGSRGFELPNGGIYLETHHVESLSSGGLDRLHNVVALCAGHHREAHFGVRRGEIKTRLVDFLERSRLPDLVDIQQN